MKRTKLFDPIARTAFLFLLLAFCAAPVHSRITLFQDARTDAVIVSVGKGTCKGNLAQIAVKNNSTTQKLNVMIIKKETSRDLTTTSSVKYSGLPPGYKQVLGCGGVAGTTDSLVITYTVAAAAYAK